MAKTLDIEDAQNAEFESQSQTLTYLDRVQQEWERLRDEERAEPQTNSVARAALAKCRALLAEHDETPRPQYAPIPTPVDGRIFQWRQDARDARPLTWDELL